MSDLLSPNWSRIANIRPRLRAHAEIHRQIQRGDRWYVLQDHVRGTYYRFPVTTYLILSLMDGNRTLNEIWERAAERLGDDVPSQEQVLQLVAQLYNAEVLRADVPPDLQEMTDRSARTRRLKVFQGILNPLAIRIPLLDPDRFLDATLPFVRPIFSRAGFVAWLVLVAVAAVQAGINFDAITKDIGDRVLAAGNLAVIGVVYPIIKAIHELGHGYMVKRFGGTVHEMGILMLVFMPLPYVDASTSSAFREKSQRILVGAAGIIVELAIASVALLVWLSVEPGLMSAIAYNAMLIAGVSTLLFNGNPLVRFDGYYVFTDLIEIPNLGNRSRRFVLYLIQRYILGGRDIPPPPSVPSERKWLMVYGVASFFYRLGVMTGIVLFVASKFFFIGTLLAVWAAFNMFVTPIVKGVLFVFRSPRLATVRRRAVVTAVGGIAAAAVVIFTVPLPFSTIAQGVVWTPEESRVLAQADGFVSGLVAAPNQWVKKGTVLVRMSDPLIQARMRVLEAQLHELRLRYNAALVSDRVQARLVADQVKHTQEQLDVERQRAADLIVRSRAAGRFVVPRPEDLMGRFLHRSDLIGYVDDPVHPVIRAVVRQADIQLVRDDTRSVALRFVDRPAGVVPAVISREVPSATNQLPHGALSVAGGGKIAMDPRSSQSPRTLERVFQFEIEAPPGADPGAAIGMRVFVKFEHEGIPLAGRIYRAVRQLFLRRFNV